MKKLEFLLLICSLLWLMQSCTTTRRYGTTVERDENNPCQIKMVIQIGIEGTDTDVRKVKADLDACFGKECFIPCDEDKTKGCKTSIEVVVKKWSSIPEIEQEGYHYVQMVDEDGQPSNAYIGQPNKGTSSGTWRRDAHPRTYCHEVLHLCGLKDQYCSRIFDPVRNIVVNELNCETPPDPSAGNCCTPTARYTRCSSACTGHEHDLMASLSPELSCQNIKDVLKLAGIEKCPDECCKSDRTFSDPDASVYVIPGYMRFGDKNYKTGTIGATVGGIWNVTPKLGITAEGSYYTHTEKHPIYKEQTGILSISAGVTYRPYDFSAGKADFSVAVQVQAGYALYSQKYKGGMSNFSQKEGSLTAKVGAGLDWQLNRKWSVRVIQACYTPTFFYDATQHNFSIGAGILYNLHWKN